MRVLFLFLLLLNIAYFAWQFTRSSPELTVEAPALEDVQPIVLLSEAKKAKEREAKIREAKAREDDRKKLSADALAGHAVVASAKVNNVMKESVSNKKATPDVNAKERASAVVAKAEKDALPSVEQCFTMGPFRDLEKLRGLTRAIKSYVVAADFRGKQEKTPPLYWIYTRPEKNKRLTEKVADRLRAKKIKDFYIIHSDNKINSISLGRFKNKVGAQRYVKKLEKLGFNVEVEVVRKDITIYWLDYRLAAGSSIPESVFIKFKPSDKQAASRLSRECDS